MHAQPMSKKHSFLSSFFLKKNLIFIPLCQKSSAHGWMAARAGVKEEAATRWA